LILARVTNLGGLMTTFVCLLISFIELQPPTKKQKEIAEEADEIMAAMEVLKKAKEKARAQGLHHCPMCGIPAVKREAYAHHLSVSAFVRGKLQQKTGLIPLALALCRNCMDNFSRAILIEFQDKPYFKPKRNVFVITMPNFEMKKDEDE
jgi:hypothetical protein